MGGNSSTDHINEAMNKDVATAKPLATINDLRKALPAADTLRYVKNDTFIADPTLLLGRVYFEKTGSDALIPFHTQIAVSADDRSLLKAPLTVSELIIDSKMSASAEVLSFVSLSVSNDEVYELRVINNAAARAKDSGDPWDLALKKWLDNSLCQRLINDKAVGAISIVTGVVQKYLTSKKYRKFEAGAKGGGWGVNVAGNLYTSSSEFQLDVLYGLDLVSFPRADDVNQFAENIAKGQRLTTPDELATVNKLFFNMARQRASIFRLSDT
jgi:hypothetical protein